MNVAARTERWLGEHWRRARFSVVIGTLLVAILVVYFWPRVFVTIKPGFRGVLFRRFGEGTVLDRVFGEGVQLTWPWNVMTVYDTRVQRGIVHCDALSREGLPVRIDITINYRPRLDRLPQLHAEIGTNYFDSVVGVEVQAVARRITGYFTAEELYTNHRNLLDNALGVITDAVGQYHIVVKSFLITQVTLPQSVVQAIESKVQRQHAVEREVEEKKRKEIEASALKDYFTIFRESPAVTEQYLRWKSIEATLELAKSPNAKVVVMGGGKDSTPLIINPDAVAPAGAAAPAGPGR